jgi:hypothetical protein
MAGSKNRHASILVAVFIFRMCLPFFDEATGGNIFMGDKVTDLPTAINQLGAKAKKMTLMIVPSHVLFRASVSKAMLSRVSCVYDLNADRGQTFGRVLNILKESIVEESGRAPGLLDLRLGIILDEVQVSFYFEDGSSTRNIGGMFNNNGILMSANMTSRIRELLTSDDVILTRSGHFDCPHR